MSSGVFNELEELKRNYERACKDVENLTRKNVELTKEIKLLSARLRYHEAENEDSERKEEAAEQDAETKHKNTHGPNSLWADDIEETYLKKSGMINLDGIVYEEKICLLLFLKLINLGASFKMCSNLKDAGLFDDVVINYTYTNIMGGVENGTIFVQLKYFLNTKSPKLVSFQWKNINHFSLGKFFFSFLSCQNKFVIEDSIFGTDPERRHYVVYTNADVERNDIFSVVGDVTGPLKDIVTGDVLKIKDSVVSSDDFHYYKTLYDYVHDYKQERSEKSFERYLENILTSEPNHPKRTILQMVRRGELTPDLVEDIFGSNDLRYHFEDFADKFRFCCKQVGLQELDKLVKDEIETALEASAEDVEKIYIKLMQDIGTWREKCNYYLSENSSMWKNILRDLEYSKFDKREKELSCMGIKFRTYVLRDLRHDMETNRANVINIISDGDLTIDTMLKVWQILHSRRKRDFLLVNGEDCMTKPDIFEKFWPSPWCRTLVVECRENYETAERIFQKLSKIFSELHEQRAEVILVSPQNLNVGALFKKATAIRYHELKIESFFSHLSASSKIELYNRNIDIQGHVQSLKSLFEKQDMDTLSSDALSLLITHNTISIGKNLTRDQFPEYVSRSFMVPFVNPDILKTSKKNFILAIEANVDCLLKLQNILNLRTVKEITEPPDEAGKRAIIILGKGEEQREYLELCKVYRNVHWMKLSDNNLKWVRTSGDVSTIRKYLSEDIHVDEEDLFHTDKNKLILISGESGIGKTTSLQHISYLLKRLYPRKFLISLNGSMFCKHLNSENSSKDEVMIEVFRRALKLDSSKEPYFMMCLKNPESVIILFDGLDEVNEKDLSVILSIINHWTSKVYKMVLVCRRHLQPTIEDFFSIVSYSLAPIDTEVYVSCWIRQNIADKFVSDQAFRNAMEFLKGVSGWASSENNLFTSNPQYLSILLQYFFDDVESLQESYHDKTKLNIYDVISTVVQKKCMIFFTENLNKNTFLPAVRKQLEEFTLNFIEKNKYIGASIVFNEEYLGKEQAGNLKKQADEYLTSDRELFHRVGISFSETSEGWEFVHNLFAKYFAALWLVQNYKDNESIITNFIFRGEMQIVRVFFDLDVASKCSIHTAIINKQRNVKLLINDENIRQFDKMGRTALHLSAAYNDVETTINLLEWKCDVFSRDVRGLTPIHYAIKMHSWVLADMLLSHHYVQDWAKSLWDCIEPFVNEVVFECCVRGLSNLLRLVNEFLHLNSPFPVPFSPKKEKFSEKAEFEETNFGKHKSHKDYYTPMFVAVEYHNINIMKILMKNTSDLHVKDKGGYTLLHVAAANGYTHLVEFLVSAGLDPNTFSTDSYKITPLQIACIYGHVQLMKALISKGGNIHLRNKFKDNSILLASRHGQLEVIKFCTTLNACLSSVNNYGYNSLLMASKHGHLEVVKYCLQKGENMEKCTNYGYNALLLAAESGHLDIVEFVIQNGADINYSNSFGYNALLLGAKNDHFSIVQYCLEAGIDFRKVTSKGYDALYVSLKNKRYDIAKYILNHEATSREKWLNKVKSLFLVSRFGDLNAVKLLHNYGVDFDQVDEKGETPILTALNSGHTNIVKYMLQNGVRLQHMMCQIQKAVWHSIQKGRLNILKLLVSSAINIDLEDNNLDTPLIISSHFGMIHIVKFCLENLANVNHENEYKDTALLVASGGGHLETVRYLVENGANINHKNIRGNTALSLASSKGKCEIVKYLVHCGAKTSSVNDNSDTALLMAAENGHINTVKYFLSTGEDSNNTNKQGDTPLLLASKNGHIDIIRLLVQHGANIDSVNDNGDTPLLLAAENGHIDTVKYFLSAGEDMNHTNDQGYTPLLLASKNGHIDIIRLLVQHGANIDSVNDNGDTPLLLAAENGHIDTVKYFLSAGEDINHTNDQGYTPLLLASKNGHIDIIRLLVQHGANIDSFNYNYDSPLLLAAKNGHIDTVKYFLSTGQDINHTNKQGDTPLLLASKNEHIDIIQSLLQYGANINSFNKNRDSPLLLAAENGHIDTVKYFLRTGQDINHTNNQGDTPLLLASKNGHIDIIRLLVQHGANIDSVNDNGDSPLLLAAKNGHIDTVKYFLSTGEDINHTNKQRDTPLLLASESGHIDTIRLLVHHGANIDSLNKNRDTALLLAAKNGHIDTVKYFLSTGEDINHTNKQREYGREDNVRLLVEHGANVNSANMNGDTPLLLAVKYGCKDIVRLLVEHGANINSVNMMRDTPLLLAVKNFHEDIGRFLLEHGANVNSANMNRDTPLLLAVKYGRKDNVRLLVEHGANVNSANMNGDTPLLLALKYGRKDYVRLLVKHGANVNSANMNGDTPLLLALKYGRKDNVRLLVEHGANVNSANMNGDTPLLLALKYGRKDYVRLLVKHGANVNSANMNGDTPLLLAAKKGHVAIE